MHHVLLVIFTLTPQQRGLGQRHDRKLIVGCRREHAIELLPARGIAVEGNVPEQFAFKRFALALHHPERTPPVPLLA